jgi:Mg-chelatase subunit ChlD
VALLKNKLDLRPVPNTSLLEIGVKSDKPEEAARVANAVAEAYRARRLEQRAQLSNGGITALEERFAEQEQKVREAQKKVDDLREELSISDGVADGAGPSPLMSADTVRKLESLRIESKAEYDRERVLVDRLKHIGKELGPEGLAQAIPTAASDPGLSSLLEQLTVAGQKRAALEKERGPTDPDVLKGKAAEEDLHNKIKARVDGIMRGLDARVFAMRNTLGNSQKELAKATQSDINRTNQARQADAAPPKPAAPASIPQPEVQTADNAFSTFSLNVSDVSFKLAAASLGKGVMPEPANVRSEEFINAFDYRDPEPPPGVPIAFAWERAQYPFAQNRDLLRFSIKTAALGRQPGRPLNLVLLLDNSGSMERADRVSIIREALRVLAEQLQPQDKLSVITFARTPRLFADGAPGSDAGAIAMALTELTPQGGTNLEDAMNLAYQTALRHYLANGVNRVVLLTDGAANLGDVDPEALKQKVEANRKQGIALDCFGIGWEGYNDDLLEVLSRNGDGRYGFVNTPEEAAMEFAGQLAGALHVAASDVKVQVEFNPARVTAYRQIGYAKHQLTKEQFRDNTVDAAEIGAAESGNALYAIEANPRGDGPLATVRVRYKVPGTTDYHEHEWPVPYTGNAVALEQASPAMRLAATASAFSEWLVSSPYAGEVSPDRLLGYLSGVPEVYGADARPKKLEWMVRQAKSIAGK